jgi:hypothetical protein
MNQVPAARLLVIAGILLTLVRRSAAIRATVGDG